MKALKLINLAAGIAAIVLLGLAGAYLQKLLNKEPVDNTPAITLKSAQLCNLNQQSCIAGLDNKKIELSLQRPVRYLTKFQAAARVSGFENPGINKVIIDFTMPGMDMGINRFALQETSTPNQWQGTAILPVCITGRMDWQVKVFVATNETDYTATYKLTVEK